MGGCCGAMKTGQKSLPDKKKSADPIQEKTNGKEAAQAQSTVSANDTGKATKDEGEHHAEQKSKDVESHAPEQIAVPVKASFSHAEPAVGTVEPPVQAAENVMDLETAVAPFESLPSSGDPSQQEAQGSITSAEPEVLLPFQIPVQHTFTSATTTTTAIRHDENHEEFKLRVDEPQLDIASPGDVQLSITEYVTPDPVEVSSDERIHAKSFATAEVESVPDHLSAEKIEVGDEDAVTRVERAILEAQLPVEDDLPPPPPPPLESSQPDELEAGGRFEVDASVPLPAPLEASIESVQRPEAGVLICRLERRPSPEPEPDHKPTVLICPLERKPSPEPEPRPKPIVMVCPLERRPSPEPRPDSGVLICPLERQPSPEPRPDSGVLICPLERQPSPEPWPDSVVLVCPPEPLRLPEPVIAICPCFPDDILDEAVEQSKTVQDNEAPESSFQELGFTDLGTTAVHKSVHVQEPEPAPVPESISFEESTATEAAAIPPVLLPPEEVAFAEEAHFQEQVPVELGFGSRLEGEPQDDLPPPVAEDPAIYDPLLESYDALGASAEPLPQPPVEEEIRNEESNVTFPDNEQFRDQQPLPDQTEQTAVTTQQEQLSEEPAPYQEQQAELLEPYHELKEPIPYQEHQPPEESAFQPEQQLQDSASQLTSGTFEKAGDAEQCSLQEQEQPPEISDALPVLEVVSEGAQESRDAWWSESGKEENGQQTTADDIPVLELVSDQVREAHHIWWNQSGAETETALPDALLLETTQPPSTDQDSSSTEEPSSIPLTSETQPAETAPIQPEETISPLADGSSFPEVTPEPVFSSPPDHVINKQEAEIIPRTKELPIVESPLSADGSSSSPVATENGEVSTLSSSETASLSNLSPEGIDGDPAAATAVAAGRTEEPIPAQA